jgi:general secretion pathway protein B
MSYILDALRRADAERERGAVPGLHARPAPADADAARAPAAIGPGTWVLAIAVVLAVLVAVSWQWLTPETPRVAVAPAAPPAAPPAVPVAPPRATAPAALDPIPAPRPAVSAATAKEPATAERIYTIAELPEEIRRQLPTITVGGSMYSDDAARRMLIINGQLYHEHDQLAPGVTLEQIKLKAAIVKFQGYRYTINF